MLVAPPILVAPPTPAARQEPLLQVVPAAHLFPQLPQLEESLLMLTQVVPQAVEPGAQPPHSPNEQLRPLEHLMPQSPQLLGSALSATQTPLQGACSAGHKQEPLLHWAPVAHAKPHCPQLLPSVMRSAQPLLQVTRPFAQSNAPGTLTMVTAEHPKTGRSRHCPSTHSAGGPHCVVSSHAVPSAWYAVQMPVVTGSVLVLPEQ